MQAQYRRQARQRLETTSMVPPRCGMPRGPAFAHGPPRQEVLPDNCMTPHCQLPSHSLSLPRTWLRSNANAIANACLLNFPSLPAIVPTVRQFCDEIQRTTVHLAEATNLFARGFGRPQVPGSLGGQCLWAPGAATRARWGQHSRPSR